MPGRIFRTILLLLSVTLLPLAWCGAAEVPVPLTVGDIKEKSFDNRPALAVVFSTPLATLNRYGDQLRVTRVDNGSEVGGEWVLGSGGRALYFPHVEPNTHYRVFVQRGIKAANGTTLANSSEQEVTTRALEPGFDFASSGSVLIPGVSDGLPIMTVEVPEVDVEFLRVRDEELVAFIKGHYLNHRSNNMWVLGQIAKKAESVHIARYTTAAKRFQRAVSFLPVFENRELTRPGMYVAVMRVPGDFGYHGNKSSFFFVSDIGLQVRQYADDIQVTATSLKSAAPMPDVRLSLYRDDKEAERHIYTDAAGQAIFPGRANNGVIVAQAGDQFSIVNLAQPAVDLSEFAVDGPATRPFEAFLFSNRDLFRPGESLELSALLRNGDGKPTHAVPITLKVKKPNGQEYANRTVVPDAMGFLRQQVELPDGPTGRWRADAYIGNGSESLGSFEFNVEEFLPERVKLTLDSEQAQFGAGDTWQVDAEGAFLYGAPTAGNRLEAILNVSLALHPFEKFADFTFGDAEEAGKAYRETVFDGKLDAAGRTRIDVAPKQDFGSPMNFVLTGNLYESGGRPVSRSLRTVYWPGEAAVGVRPLWSGDHAKSHSTADLELVRLDRNGAPAPAKGLTATLEREERDYYWYFQRGNGWQRDASTTRYSIGAWNVDTDANGVAKVRVPVEWGWYHLLVEDPATGLTSRYRFRAGWRHDNADARSARPDAVAMALDKAAYRAGETAQLTIKPPAAGKAMVRVESDQLLWQQWVDLPAEGTTLPITVDPAWDGRHDLYLSVVSYRPAAAGERVTPTRAVGVLHLPLDRSDRRLDTAIVATPVAEPEKPLPIKVSVPGAAGKDAFVVVAAVDSGILNITDFATPDAALQFFAKRRYGVEARDIYDRIIEAMDGGMARLRFGGDAVSSAMAGDSARSRLPKAERQMVAFTTGAVRLDAEGNADVSFDLPDFNGELRLMALAFTADAFGSADAKVKVRAPVVAEINLPRFLAFEDEAMVSLELHNLSGQQQDLALTMTAAGPIETTGLPPTVTLADGERRLLRFPLSAAYRFGVGRLALTVAGQGVSLQRHWELGVRPPWSGEKRVHHLVLKPGTTETLPTALLEGLRPETAVAVLSASVQPPLDVREAIEGLLGYPYGCLEQTASQAYPLIYVNEQKAIQFGLKPLTDAERAKRVEKGLKRLAEMQLSSGGFALWGRDGREEIWLTPYAVNFLLEARERGFSVPNEMLDKGMGRLEAMLRGNAAFSLDRYRSEHTAHLLFAGRAFAAYALAKTRRAPLGALRTLYERDRGEARSGLPLVHLGLALRLQGDTRLGDAAIAEGLAKERSSGYYGDYGSDIRDTGMMIALLFGNDVAPAGLHELVYRLAQKVRDTRWLSTQERTALFLASDAMMRSVGHEVDVRVAHGGAERTVDGAPTRSVVVDGVQAGDALTVTSASDADQYLIFTVTGYTDKPPARDESDYIIERDFYTLDGTPLGERDVTVGEFLVAHLKVRADRWSENVLLEELLPAGLEVENLNIGRGEGLDNITIGEINAGAAMRADVIRHVEYRDDRFVVAAVTDDYTTLNLFYLVRAVTPGRFAFPPTAVEDMYDAERRGIGSTPGRLTILFEAEGK